jgi:DNA polymerase V
MIREREQEEKRAITGFQSPAGDYQEMGLDISRLIVRDPVNTYYQRMDSNAMSGSGIMKGAILVIDRSITPQPGDVIAAWYHNELVVRRFDVVNDKLFLHPHNSNYAVVEITDKNSFVIEGVVTWNNNCHCTREFPVL